jgi:SAM-dependent methyltransferase
LNDALPAAPAAERNKEPILQVLLPLLPASGTVLEIASGTGQHVAHFAAATPHLSWQPSDPEPHSVAMIAARLAAGALRNVRAPLLLDVHEDPWPAAAHCDFLVCINMIHIAPWSATAALFHGARRHLRRAGACCLLTYGPYMEGGAASAPSNAAFDRSLRERNPDWGVRDLDAVAAVALQAGFRLAAIERMPANNLCVVWRAADR